MSSKSFVQNNIIKSEDKDEGTIIDLNTGIITFYNKNKKNYWSGTLKELDAEFDNIFGNYMLYIFDINVPNIDWICLVGDCRVVWSL
jgi:hypothetical protein